MKTNAVHALTNTELQHNVCNINGLNVLHLKYCDVFKGRNPFMTTV
jgi:hypothetical protein